VIGSSTAVEAKNTASNYFTQADDNAVCFGDTTFYPGTVAAVKAEVICVIAIHDPHNATWKDRLKATEEWEKKLAEQIREAKVDGPS